MRNVYILLVTCIFLSSAAIAQNKIRVQGTVTDPDAIPLPGATVIEEGTTNGTVTDVDGSFSLEVSEGAILKATFVGFLSQSKAIGNQTNISFSLKDDLTALDEVVVVGYGTQSKRDYTGAVESISLDRIDSKPNTNFSQALQGAIPGVNVTTNSAGAEQSNVGILIRGRNSINASNNPLIVLDGIPYAGNISDINTSDISSINVLKDASATAIYGSRGANGVILIETKRGKTKKPTISYTGYYGIADIVNVPEVYDGQGFAEFKEEREPDNLTTSELEVLNATGGAGTDWIALATQRGEKQEHTLSISGGTDRLNYYVSTSLLDVKGISVNDQFNRYSLRLNFRFNITDDLTFGTNTQLSRIDRSGLDVAYDGYRGAFQMNPLTTAYDENGEPTLFPWPEDQFFWNPLRNTLAVNDDINNKVFTSNFLEYNFPFLEGLSFRLNTGVEYGHRQIGTYYGRNTAPGLLSLGEASTSNRIDENYLIENILKYHNTFGKHTIGFTGLYSYQGTKTQRHDLDASGFPSDILTYYQMELGSEIVPSSGFTKETLLSQMGRLNYSYGGRYLLTFTARRDGFSGFGDQVKYGVFPSVAVGWNISEESFYPTQQTLSYLKLRLSHGVNGNQAVGPYDNLARLRERSYVIGSQTAPGFVPQTLSNNNLSWESTTTSNIGLDLGFSEDRITSSINIYRSRTSDLLLDRRIPSVYGIQEITQNVGETQNQGIELNLAGYVIDKDEFSWNASVNASYNKNEIVSLFGGKQDDVANQLFIGKPIRVNYGFVFDGIWQEGDDIANSSQPDAEPGFVKIKDIENPLDVDGNPILGITGDDRAIQGQRDPKFIWGTQHTFTYKQLSLYVFVHGVSGVTRNNTTKDVDVQGGVRNNNIVLEFWTPENPINTFYKNTLGANARGVNFYESADFVRLKDVTLSYRFQEQWFGKTGFSNAQVYFTGRNLYTITQWDGLDPELNDQFSIPLQREFIVGLKFSL